MIKYWFRLSYRGKLGTTSFSDPLRGLSAGNIAGHAITGAASSIANAATRSAIEGSSFGRNIAAAIPDVIGSTIGNIIGGAVGGGGNALGKDNELLKNAGIDKADRKAILELKKQGRLFIFNQGGEVDPEQIRTAVKLTERIERIAPQYAIAGGEYAKAFDQFRADFDRAILSIDSYFAESVDGLLPKNYSRLTNDVDFAGTGIKANELQNVDSGYFAALYRNSVTGEYILANRGSEDIVDFTNNYQQSQGKISAQYRQAIRVAERLDDKLGSDISFTGHSLGGGLATAQALVTDRQATVFNAAGVHGDTLARFDADFSRANELIRAINVDGEILNAIQDSSTTERVLIGGVVGGIIGAYSAYNIDLPPVQGQRITIQPAIVKHNLNNGLTNSQGDNLSAVQRHSSFTVLNSLVNHFNEVIHPNIKR